jgi:hypothetical protein
MKRERSTPSRPQVRCAIYTRKSTEEGLEREFNSLDAQRECGEAYVASQAGAGWLCLPDRYDDGGFTGGNMERPALRRLPPCAASRSAAGGRFRDKLSRLSHLWLSSVELALDRIRVRVLRGGHDVPQEIVRRRYYRSLTNFFDLYQPLANTWLLCDNSRSELVEVARGGLEIATTILESRTYATIERQLADARTRG